MRPVITLTGAWLLAAPVCAQLSEHVGVYLEVLPPALRVTVTSARVDFGQQRANAGRVVLDPATGEISRKAAGRHQVGQVQVTGRAGTAYAIDVATSPFLHSSRARIGYGLRWAQSMDCTGSGYEAIVSPRMVTGLLGQSGCSSLRFGGAIALDSAAEGRYEGNLQVRIVTL